MGRKFLCVFIFCGLARLTEGCKTTKVTEKDKLLYRYIDSALKYRVAGDRKGWEQWMDSALKVENSNKH